GGARGRRDRKRAREGPRRGSNSSRREAGERDDCGRRPGEGARLRTGESWTGERGKFAGCCLLRHAGGHGAWERSLYVAGAGGRAPRRSAFGYLLLGRGALRNAQWEARVSRRLTFRDDGRDPA